MSIVLASLLGVVLGGGTDGSVVFLTRDAVSNALKRDAAVGLVAEISFTKEAWLENSGGVQPYTHQKWRLHTDAKGQVRAELGWADSSSDLRFIAVESKSRIWLSGLHSELLVIDKGDTPEIQEDIQSRVNFTQSLIRQARTEINWLLGAQVVSTQTLSIPLLDRTVTRPGAIVTVDGETLSVKFDRRQGELLIHSVLRDVGDATREWTFYDYQRIGSKWVPKIAEFQETDVHGRTNRWRYSDINVRDISTEPDLGKYFRVPEPGQTDFQAARVVRTFSGRFRDLPMAVEGVPLMPRYVQLRMDEATD